MLSTRPGPASGDHKDSFYPIMAILAMASPVITYLIATSPLTYEGKIGAVVAVSLTSAVLTIIYAARQRRLGLGSNRNAAVETAETIPDDASLSRSLTDPVTGLANERALEIVLESQLAESRLQLDERPLGLIAVEIYGLAELSDEHRPETHDRLLAFVAENLLPVVRKLDFVARVGDEFFVVLPGASRSAVIEAIARIAQHFDALPYETGSGPVAVRPIFGWATFSEDGDTADDLVRAALLQKEHAKSGAKLFEDEIDMEYVH